MSIDGGKASSERLEHVGTARRRGAGVTVLLAAVAALSVTAGSRTSMGQGAPPATSAAAPTEQAKKDAGDHFQKGLQLYREQSYDGAIIEFRRANDLAPSYKILYNIGIAYRDKQDKANALRYFERYLAEGGSEIEAKRRTEIETEVTRFHSFVAEAVVTSTVPGAEVTVDDDVVGHTPLDHAIYLNLGRHRIAATKEGFTPATRTVTVASGDKLNLPMELKDAKAVAAPPVAPTAPPPTATAPATTSAPPPPPPPPPQEPSHALAYTALGVGGVGIVVGSIFGLTAASAYRSAKDSCPTYTGCLQTAVDDRNTALTRAWVSDVGFGIGLVGVVAGTVLLLTDSPSPSGEATPAPAVSFGVNASHGASASLSGRFLAEKISTNANSRAARGSLCEIEAQDTRRIASDSTDISPGASPRHANRQ